MITCAHLYKKKSHSKNIHCTSEHVLTYKINCIKMHAGIKNET